MVKFRQIFENGKESTTFYVSLKKFWGWFNSVDLFKGTYPNRFDEPDGTILYIYNHKKFGNNKKPIRFNFTTWEGVSETKFFDDIDDFWDYYHSLGVDYAPNELSLGDKTFFSLDMQSNLFA